MNENKKELLTKNQLKLIMPSLNNIKITNYLSFLNSSMEKAKINTSLRISAFLAQLAHESCELRYWEELATGEAYENRLDLGNIHKGDGPLFKGRGPIQITGRKNYELLSQALGENFVAEPWKASSPTWGFSIATYFWTTLAGQRLSKFATKKGVPIGCNLNDLADKKEFHLICYAINGGVNGLDQRIRYYEKALDVLAEKN